MLNILVSDGDPEGHEIGFKYEYYIHVRKTGQNYATGVKQFSAPTLVIASNWIRLDQTRSKSRLNQV